MKITDKQFRLDFRKVNKNLIQKLFFNFTD